MSRHILVVDDVPAIVDLLISQLSSIGYPCVGAYDRTNLENLFRLTLAKLAESRDERTGSHLERIAAYSRRLAEVSQGSSYGGRINAEFIDDLYKSSPLHDIGKVAIRDEILLAPRALTADELREMRTHTTIGGDLLGDVIRSYRDQTFLRMGMEIAYFHHERWDGNGYPRGLAGSEIPLAARIVALVDAYDTITTNRPYKIAYDHEEAVRRIRIDNERHFDPILVAAFLDSHESFHQIQAETKQREAPTPGLRLRDYEGETPTLEDVTYR